MNYSLDPLTAITARPSFWMHTNNFCIKNDRIYKKKKLTCASLTKEFNASQSVINRIKIELFGDRRELNEDEYNRVRDRLKVWKPYTRPKNPYTIIALAEKHGINLNTAISKSIKLLGKRCNYTSEEFEMLNNYFANVIIKRPMKRVKK